MTRRELFNCLLNFLDDSDCIRCIDCEHMRECWSDETILTDEIKQLRDCEFFLKKGSDVYGMDTRTTQTV